MRLMAMVLVLVAGQAMAGGKHDPVGNHAESGSVAVAGASAGAVADASAGAEATGGDALAVANGGSAEGGNGGSASAVGEVNVSGDDYDRPAPAIGLVPQMGNVTCLRAVGVGGSNTNGAILLGPSWRDRDCVALEQFALLSELGMAEPAARAYCDRPRLAKPFGGQEPCFTAMRDHLAWLHKPAEPVEPVVIEDVACREGLRRCEATVGK